MPTVLDDAGQHRIDGRRGFPGAIQATGTPHMPLITWVKFSARRWSTMTTEEDWPMSEHRARTAWVWPALTLCWASPPELACRPPPTPEWVSPKPKEVVTAGSSIAPTQNAPTKPAVTEPAPRSRARRVSQAAVQVASRTKPGITIGTSRLLAHGWSGTVNGCHSTAADPAKMIAIGSAQFSRAPDSVVPGEQRAQAALDHHGGAEGGEQDGGDARVPDHPVQRVL